MTEYTSSPAAIEQYRSARARTADWVTHHTHEPNYFVSPSVPPSLINDSDDGMSTPSDSDFSSHSVPPRMMLKYPDGRPDVPISESAGYSDDTRTSNRDRRKEVDGWAINSPYAAVPVTPYQSSHPSRRTATHPHATPHYPPTTSYPSSSTVLMVPPPHHASHYQAPEEIQIHPSQGNPYSSFAPATPRAHGSGSLPSKSMHSSHSKRSTTSHPPLQMIYTPPQPSSHPPIPVSPTRSHHTQNDRPREILSPSPVYAYANKPELADDRVAEPETQKTPIAVPTEFPRGRTSHSAAHTSSRSQVFPASHHSHSLSKSSSGSTGGDKGHKPPSIVYAPSKHSSSASYSYNPPLITTQSPYSAVPMQRTPSQHPSSHHQQPSHPPSHRTTHGRSHSQPRSQPPPSQRLPASQMIPSYSDPTHNRDRSVHDGSRYYTPRPHDHHANGRKIYEQYDRGGRGREERYAPDDHYRDSHSSGGSTYYVIPA